MRIETHILIPLLAALLVSCARIPVQPPEATLTIVGAVERPGRYTIADVDDLNLHDLIQQSGGLRFASPGSRGEITLIRESGAPKGRVIRIDPFRLMAEGEESELNIELSNGDLVKIRRQYD